LVALLKRLALDARLPTMHDYRGIVEGRPDVLWTRLPGSIPPRGRSGRQDSARGQPGDIPVEQADKFELVVNLKTAKSLGLTIPESFLLR
jgi:putative tryptophan/tyrosine transport system substrate-binding protein